MRDDTIKCDHCGHDITSTGNSVDYRLHLEVQEKPHHGCTITDMYILPPLDRDYDFCGMNCLTKWIESKPKHNPI